MINYLTRCGSRNANETSRRNKQLKDNFLHYDKTRSTNSYVLINKEHNSNKIQMLCLVFKELKKSIM